MLSVQWTTKERVSFSLCHHIQCSAMQKSTESYVQAQAMKPDNIHNCWWWKRKFCTCSSWFWSWRIWWLSVNLNFNNLCVSVYGIYLCSYGKWNAYYQVHTKYTSYRFIIISFFFLLIFHSLAYQFIRYAYVYIIIITYIIINSGYTMRFCSLSILLFYYLTFVFTLLVNLNVNITNIKMKIYCYAKYA